MEFSFIFIYINYYKTVPRLKTVRGVSASSTVMFNLYQYATSESFFTCLPQGFRIFLKGRFVLTLQNEWLVGLIRGERFLCFEHCWMSYVSCRIIVGFDALPAWRNRARFEQKKQKLIFYIIIENNIC
jgi:hypothetical protein